jgi:hypothetical protein
LKVERIGWAAMHWAASLSASGATHQQPGATPQGKCIFNSQALKARVIGNHNKRGDSSTSVKPESRLQRWILLHIDAWGAAPG